MTYRGSLVRAFFGSQENAHEPNNAPVKYIDILYIMVDLARADSFTGARTSVGMSMREIRDDSFTGALTGARTSEGIRMSQIP